MARESKNQLVEAIAKLIELTQSGRLKWERADTAGLTSDAETRKTEQIFSTVYRDQKLRIYRLSTLQERPAQFSAFVATSLINKPSIERYWAQRVVLQFLDADGKATWSFPKNDALDDLLTAVQYQTAGVNKFLDALLAEE
jgi:hypothetical protein